jgi:hypothetical protein
LKLEMLLDARSEGMVRDEVSVWEGQIRHWRPIAPAIKPTPYGFRFIREPIRCHLRILHDLLRKSKKNASYHFVNAL